MLNPALPDPYGDSGTAARPEVRAGSGPRNGSGPPRNGAGESHGAGKGHGAGARDGAGSGEPPGVAEAGTIDDVRARARSLLDPVRRTWLRDALAEAERAPGEGAWELYFASAGRHCGRGAAADVRVLLLHAAHADADTLARLYRQGTAAERAAVLRALPHLPAGRTPVALPLVEDALRANDTSLVAAAVGPYGAAWLDAHGWRHAVLKCLFTGVSLDAVSGLARRAAGDGELARMLGDFARERTAAGRHVPAGLHRALELTATAPGTSGGALDGSGAGEPDAPVSQPEES